MSQEKLRNDTIRQFKAAVDVKAVTRRKVRAHHFAILQIELDVQEDPLAGSFDIRMRDGHQRPPVSPDQPVP